MTQPSAPQPSETLASHAATPRSSRNPRNRALALGIGVGVLGTTLVGGLGLASASGSKAPHAAASSGAAADPGTSDTKGKHHRGLGATALGHILHGEGVVKTKKGYQTVDVARGTFTVTGTSITVKSADGAVSPAFTLGPDTKVRAAKQKAATSAVTSGKQGEIVGIKSATGLVARLVVVK